MFFAKLFFIFFFYKLLRDLEITFGCVHIFFKNISRIQNWITLFLSGWLEWMASGWLTLGEWLGWMTWMGDVILEANWDLVRRSLDYNEVRWDFRKRTIIRIIFCCFFIFFIFFCIICSLFCLEREMFFG